MKSIYQKISVLIILAISMSGCEKALEEEVYSQIDPSNLLNTEAGINSLLGSAYGFTQIADRTRINMGEYPTDIIFQSGGFENGVAIPFLTFTWDPAHVYFSRYYFQAYEAIRDANTLLDNIDIVDIEESTKNQYIAEARFIRAFNYVRLYTWFGPVPLRTTTEGELNLPRATDAEMRSFIEQELIFAGNNLPTPGEESAYGKATKGSALGVLTKFYLNTKQWQKCADAAQEVINLSYYALFPVYADMLKVENEGNSEIIWVNAANPQNGNNYISAAFPPGFKLWPETNLQFQSNWRNPQTQYRLRDGFFDSFAEGDKRTDAIMQEYINNNDQMIDLTAQTDNTRSFRFYPDPDAQNESHGNDAPEVRYADILLSRAEALNELSGPSQEALDLINEVRTRAGVIDLQLTDFPDAASLRDHLLMERAWEFYNEGLRREDLLRMGKFIEYARDRGLTNAQDYHRIYPLPENAMDSNPELVQNDGY